MTIYRGVGGVNREIKQQFRGVGGVNREIKEQYRGVGGVNRRVFDKGMIAVVTIPSEAIKATIPKNLPYSSTNPIVFEILGDVAPRDTFMQIQFPYVMVNSGDHVTLTYSHYCSLYKNNQYYCDLSVLRPDGQWTNSSIYPISGTGSGTYSVVMPAGTLKILTLQLSRNSIYTDRKVTLTSIKINDTLIF